MSRLVQVKTFQPGKPGSGEVARYTDKNDVPHTIDELGVDTVISGRAWYNWLANSGFWFAQRQAPATLTTYSSTASRVPTADRWCITNENASTQYQRTDTNAAPEAGLQARYYGNYTKLTTQGKIVISQMVAMTETLGLRGQTLRLQMKLKALGTTGFNDNVWKIGLIFITSSSAVGNQTGATFISAFGGAGIDPTLGANIEYVQPVVGQSPDNCVLVLNGAACTVSSSWQRFGALFNLPANCRNVLAVIWSDDQVRVGNGVAISEVALVNGSEPQAWSPHDYSCELLRVQRNYAKTFAVDTAPAQNIGINTGNLDCIAGKAGATALAAIWSWRLEARIAPSSAIVVTTYNPAAANALGRDVAAGADLSTMASVNAAALDVVLITATGNAATAVGNQLSVHASIDAELI